jgi:hypothetical protein
VTKLRHTTRQAVLLWDVVLNPFRQKGETTLPVPDFFKNFKKYAKRYGYSLQMNCISEHKEKGPSLVYGYVVPAL